MPSTMVHLLTALKYDPNTSSVFLIGNIAPDIVSERTEKDKSHFRDKADRLSALRELANSMNLDDDYDKGVLLHLFLDYYWDSFPMRNFIENFNEGHWFPAYRHEIALAGGWLFHNSDWGIEVWDDMMKYISQSSDSIHKGINDNVAEFIKRNNKWHRESNIGPSTAFSPDFIDDFTNKVVAKFKNWLKKEGL